MRVSKRGLTNRMSAIVLSVALAAVVLLLGATTLYAQEGVPDPQAPQSADLSTSTKSVDIADPLPGDDVRYTIAVINSGVDTAAGVMLTDTLPSGVTFVDDSLSLTSTGFISGTSQAAAAGVITAAADFLGAGATMTLTFDVMVDADVISGTLITNTVQITGDGSLVSADATFTVITEPPPGPQDLVLYLPHITTSLNPPVLNPIGRANSANQWTVSWSYPNAGAVSFTVQEAKNPDFIGATETTVNGLSLNVTQPLSWDNEYFYRVRVNAGAQSSEWSNVHSVVGGYLDQFNDVNSGWLTRYSTFIEEVRAFYENGNLIVQSEDSWDWGIASPLRKAPPVPYAIEIRNQPAALGNLVSMGVVFSGDWSGAPCPDVSSVEGWYTHQNCFTQFYNVNLINKNLFAYDSFKMLFERVEERIWCPECGGSPMKRIYPSGLEVEPIPNVSQDGWNVYRIEVRETDIRLFINGLQFYTVNGTDSWINNPYFGLFVSTDEYSNSTWRIDYIQITPLDS